MNCGHAGQLMPHIGASQIVPVASFREKWCRVLPSFCPESKYTDFMIRTKHRQTTALCHLKNKRRVENYPKHSWQFSARSVKPNRQTGSDKHLVQWNKNAREREP